MCHTLCLLLAESCQNISNVHVVVESLNNTAHGLEVQFHCKEGFVPQDIVAAVCREDDGWWSLNPNEYKCGKNGTGNYTTEVTFTTTIDSAELSTNGKLLYSYIHRRI